MMKQLSKPVLTAAFCLLFTTMLIDKPVSAQIGGISGSKLSAYCTDVVNHNEIEFEPAFAYVRTRSHWDDKGKLRDSFMSRDSLDTGSGMKFRFTYGLFDKLEIGVALPYDVATASWGARYVIAQGKKSRFALMAGLTTPMGSGFSSRAVYDEENTSQAGIGLVYSWEPSDNLSVDANAQYCGYLHRLDDRGTGLLRFGADAGYYLFSRKLQIVGGLAFQQNYSGDMRRFVVTFFPGITVETNKGILLIIQHPVDIAGRNISKYSVLDIALTITLK